MMCCDCFLSIKVQNQNLYFWKSLFFHYTRSWGPTIKSIFIDCDTWEAHTNENGVSPMVLLCLLWKSSTILSWTAVSNVFSEMWKIFQRVTHTYTKWSMFWSKRVAYNVKPWGQCLFSPFVRFFQNSNDIHTFSHNFIHSISVAIFFLNNMGNVSDSTKSFSELS